MGKLKENWLLIVIIVGVVAFGILSNRPEPPPAAPPEPGRAAQPPSEPAPSSEFTPAPAPAAPGASSSPKVFACIQQFDMSREAAGVAEAIRNGVLPEYRARLAAGRHAICDALNRRDPAACKALEGVPGWASEAEGCQKAFARMILWLDLARGLQPDALDQKVCGFIARPGAAPQVCAALSTAWSSRDPRGCDKLAPFQPANFAKGCAANFGQIMAPSFRPLAGQSEQEAFEQEIRHAAWHRAPMDCAVATAAGGGEAEDQNLRHGICLSFFEPAACAKAIEPLAISYCSARP